MQPVKTSLPFRVGALGVISLVCLLVLSVSACRLPWEKSPVIIGAILDFSGPNAFLSEMRDGIQFGVDEANALDGINGREIKVIFADCQSDPEAAKKAFRDLENDHHPLVYLTSISSVGMELAPLAEEYQVPLVGLVVSSDEFTRRREWVFRYAATTAEEVRVAAAILDRLRIKRVAVLYQDDAYGAPAFAAFKEIVENQGGAVIGEAFPVSGPGPDELVSGYLNERAIYILGHTPQVKKAVVKLRALDYAGAVVGSMGLATLAGNTPEADGTYTASPIIYNPTFTFAREIQERFEDRYDQKLTLRSAAGYDFIRLLTGLLRDRELTREGTREILEAWFIYPGILGNVESEMGEHDIVYPLFPVRIEDGAITFLQ